MVTCVFYGMRAHSNQSACACAVDVAPLPELCKWINIYEFIIIISELEDAVSKARTEEIRIPFGVGIAGSVAQSKQPINIKDAYADPRFNADIDLRTGYRTRLVLCLPICNYEGDVIGVAQIINKTNGGFRYYHVYVYIPAAISSVAESGSRSLPFMGVWVFVIGEWVLVSRRGSPDGKKGENVFVHFYVFRSFFRRKATDSPVADESSSRRFSGDFPPVEVHRSDGVEMAVLKIRLFYFDVFVSGSYFFVFRFCFSLEKSTWWGICVEHKYVR